MQMFKEDENEEQLNTIPLPGMPPSVKPSDIESYLVRQKEQLGKYGPESQMSLQKDIDARRNSLGYKVADAGKGFADALMMGVAGAGNPGWQQSFREDENRAAEQKMRALKEAGESNINQINAGMILDEFDPGSALSKSSQMTYEPLYSKLTELGFQPNALKNMSKSQIETAMALMTKFGGDQLGALAQSRAVKGDPFKNESELLARFLSESDDFKKSATSYQRILDSASNPSAAGDLALIFNYMKMLDPGSTVREGEFANAQNSGGVPDIVRAQYNKVISGERLSNEMRNDFVSRADKIYGGQEERQGDREAEFKRLANAYGYNPSRVIVNLRSKNRYKPEDSSKNVPTVTSQLEYDKLKPGDQYMANGKLHRKKK